MMAPVSRARTSAPMTFGFDVTRASVVSRSALLREGDDIGMDMAMTWKLPSRQRQREFQGGSEDCGGASTRRSHSFVPGFFTCTCHGISIGQCNGEGNSVFETEGKRVFWEKPCESWETQCDLRRE